MASDGEQPHNTDEGDHLLIRSNSHAGNISPRIAPWDFEGNEPNDNHDLRADISTASKHRIQRNTPLDSGGSIRNNITVVLERKRELSPVTDKIVNLFACGSGKVVANNNSHSRDHSMYHTDEPQAVSYTHLTLPTIYSV